MDHEVSARVIINLPKDVCWEKLKDLSLPHNYVPGIIDTKITTEATSGVGASRKVFQSPTKGLDETVTEWNEGSGFMIRLHRGDQGAPPPFSQGAFRYHLEDAGNNTTALTTSLMFNMRWGALGGVLKSILNGVFKGTIRDVAISMKEFYETGDAVSPARLKELRKEQKAGV